MLYTLQVTYQDLAVISDGPVVEQVEFVPMDLLGCMSLIHTYNIDDEVNVLTYALSPVEEVSDENVQ